MDQLINGAYRRIASYPTDFTPGDAGNGVWQLFGSVNGLPEVGFIKLRNTGSGTVEVHWDAWNGSAFKRAGDYTSDFLPGDADNGAWDLFGSVNGAPELGFVKLRNTGSGTVEAHWDVLSGGRYVRAGSYRSEFSPADAGTGVWSLFGSVNGAPELGFVKLDNPGSGTVEAHWAVLSGGSYVRAGDYGSDFSIADANNGAWSLFGSVNGKPELGFIKLRWPVSPAPRRWWRALPSSPRRLWCRCHRRVAAGTSRCGSRSIGPGTTLIRGWTKSRSRACPRGRRSPCDAADAAALGQGR